MFETKELIPGTVIRTQKTACTPQNGTQEPGAPTGIKGCSGCCAICPNRGANGKCAFCEALLKGLREKEAANA